MAAMRFYLCEQCRRIFPFGVDNFTRELEEAGAEFSEPASHNKFMASEHVGHKIEEIFPIPETFHENKPACQTIGRVCTFRAIIPETDAIVTVKKSREALADPPVYELTPSESAV